MNNIFTRLKNKHLFLTLMIVVLAVWAGSNFLEQSPTQNPSVNEIYSTSSDANQFNQLSEELEALKKEVVQLVNVQRRFSRDLKTVLRQPSVAQNSTLSHADVVSSDDSVLQKDIAEEDFQDDIANYQEKFEQENIDLDWSGETELAVTNAFDDLKVPDTIIDRVECRGITCRLELVHPEGEGGDTFAESMYDTDIFAGEFFIQTDVNQNGEQRTLVYITKSGESLSIGG